MGKNKGFIQINNIILDALIMGKFNKRPGKIILLISRLTYGCNKNEAYIRIKSDFGATGISSSHIDEVLKYLIEKKILIIRDDYYYSLNTDRILGIGNVDNSKKIKLSRLIHENLSQNSNINLPVIEIDVFPKRDKVFSKNGNINKNNFPKNKSKLMSKYSNTDSIKNSVNTDNADNKVIIDPNGFNPKNAEELCALECWKAIEPDQPRFFDVYLVFSKSVPPDVMYQFKSEVLQSSCVNPGKVMVSKLFKYKKEHLLRD